jgi:hypothetical protein
VAKPLQFQLDGSIYDGVPVKLEREKLYGHVDTVATTPRGEICILANLDAGGTLIIPAGAVKNGTVGEDGIWYEKAELTAVDISGVPAEMRPSSFDAAIALTETVSEEEFLDNVWNSVYQIVNPELAAKLGNKIYKFPFNYRAGTGNDDGYLLAANGLVYLFSGDAVDFEFLGLEEKGVLDEPMQEEEIAEEDLNFDLM